MKRSKAGLDPNTHKGWATSGNQVVQSSRGPPKIEQIRYAELAQDGDVKLLGEAE